MKKWLFVLLLLPLVSAQSGEAFTRDLTEFSLYSALGGIFLFFIIVLILWIKRLWDHMT